MINGMNNTATDTADHLLIAEFKSGSMSAMEKIVERYENSIFSFGMKMCGHRQDAEDIMQDTFLNAFRSLDGFREETKLKNWLFTIATRACLKKRRKKKCEPEKELSLDSLIHEDGTGSGYDILAWSDDPSDNVLRAELKRIIDAAILSLPYKYRLVFNLRETEGFNTEETSELLGISIPSVKTRLHRARLFLRKEISDYYKEGIS